MSSSESTTFTQSRCERVTDAGLRSIEAVE